MSTRPVGIMFCPALPRPAAPPCAAPIRTARGMFGFGFDKFPDMPCMKKVYRDK